MHPYRTAEPLVVWTTIVLAAALATGFILHTRQLNAAILRTDPNLLPATPVLMSYALSRGQSTYQAYCLGCHGKIGSGNSARGIPVLSDADWLYGSGSPSDIERIVTYGIRSNNPKAWNLAAMPAFGRLHPSETNSYIQPLAPSQIRDVIGFLMLKQGRPADATAAVRGAEIYQSVGACYDCHAPDAQGDNSIGAPNLIDNVTLYGNGDRAALYDSIANGRQGICPAWVGVLSPLSIRAVALYVYKLSHPLDKG